MNGLLSQQKELLHKIRRYGALDPYHALRAQNLTKVVTHRAMTKRMINLDKRLFLVECQDTPFGRLFRLGPRGRSLFPELPANSRLFQKPSLEALARDAAVLRFAFGPDRHRPRLTKEELRKVFGEFPDSVANHPYCFDPLEKCLIRAYYPAARSPRTVAEQIRKDVYDFETAPHPFPNLLSENRLRIVILTFDPARTSQIRNQLRRSKHIPIAVQSLLRNPRNPSKDNFA